ncbi:hypothetical protein FUA23_21980, partial [Neolewinella aurantiaca]
MTNHYRTCSRLASGGQRTASFPYRLAAVFFDVSRVSGVGLPTLLGICLLPLLLLCSGCGEKDPAADAEVTTMKASAKPEPSAAEIPLVTLHTATRGRLPLRRRATGKLRARR